MVPAGRGARARSPRPAAGRRGAGRTVRLVAGLMLVAATLACGKKGRPLPPLRRNPEPILRLELAQRGKNLELAFVTPTRTVDDLQLPVLDVEVLISPETGVLSEVAEPILLKAAPGERVVHTQALPEPGTPLRIAVRTVAAGKESPLSPESLLVVKEPPPAPSDVSVRLTTEGLALTWTECVATTPGPPLPPESPAAGATGAEASAEGAPDAEPGSPEAPPEPVATEPSGAREPEPGVTPSETPEPDALEPEAPEAAAPEQPSPDVAPPAEPGEAAETGTEPPATGALAEPDASAPTATDAPVAPAPPPPPVAPSTGVRVYRRTAEENEYKAPLVASPLATGAYLDKGVAHGVEYCYILRTVLTGTPTVEGVESAEVCATFEDQLPPPAPEGLSALRRDAGIELAWSPLREGAEAPAQLRVYRSQGGGPLELVAELEGDVTRWTDPSPPVDVVLEYAITAADAVGNESPPSRRSRLIP